MASGLPPRRRADNAYLHDAGENMEGTVEEWRQILHGLMADFLAGAASVADLFSGCGTFTLPLARSSAVHAVEASRPALAALAYAARHTRGLKPVTTERPSGVP